MKTAVPLDEKNKIQTDEMDGLFRSLVEIELANSVSWLIRLRWFAGVGILFGALLVGPILKLGMPSAYYGYIGVWVLFYNLALYLINRRIQCDGGALPVCRRMAVAQIGLDWLAMAPLIHFTGGVESPVIFFFMFHVVIAATFFSRRTSFLFTILAIVLLVSISLAEYFMILPHVAIGQLKDLRLYTDPLYLAAVLIFFSIAVLIITFLVSTISDRLRRREAEVVLLSHELQHSSARLQALNDSARSITSTLELSRVLNRLVRTTAQVMDVQACSIRLLDNTGQLLNPVAVYGLSRAYMEKGPLNLDDDILDRRVLDGNVVNISDVGGSSLLQYPEEAAREGVSSMLSAPLIGKDGPLGVLRAYSIEKDRFSTDDEAFLSAIAAQGSIAIENALAFETIETLDATKTAYIRVFTHELRSPVGVTRSLLQTLLDGYVGEMNPQQLDIVERAARRVDYLQKLIDDLLDLAAGKSQDGSGEAVEPVELKGVIKKVVKRFDAKAREKSMMLQWVDETGENDVCVLATNEGLDRIFNNLVSNAVKYTPAGGRVSVTLALFDQEAYVTVDDSGIGIPQEAIPRLFDEFYRAPNAKALDREGTGLGLAIVRASLERFGGRVTVQSHEGQGTRFTVVIPLLEN